MRASQQRGARVKILLQVLIAAGLVWISSELLEIVVGGDSTHPVDHRRPLDGLVLWRIWFKHSTI